VFTDIHYIFFASVAEIRQYSEYFIFQRHGALGHRAREMVELLKEVTPDFIQPI